MIVGEETEGQGNLYIGNFKDDKYHTGDGAASIYLWREGGDQYRGGFIEGIQNGFGQLINTIKKTRYCGYFTNGERDGIGLHERASDFYIGFYSKDKSQGMGIYSNKGTESYCGEW